MGGHGPFRGLDAPLAPVANISRRRNDYNYNDYISMVAVAKDLRRQGIGRHLVEHLMKT